MTPPCEFCHEHKLHQGQISALQTSFAEMRDDIIECTNSIRESAIILENTSKSVERFNSALDVLADKIKALEVADIGRRTWEEKQAELERKFNGRLIVLFTAIGAIAAALAVWQTWR